MKILKNSDRVKAIKLLVLHVFIVRGRPALNKVLTQKDGWKTQERRTTKSKECRARPGMYSLVLCSLRG